VWTVGGVPRRRTRAGVDLVAAGRRSDTRTFADRATGGRAQPRGRGAPWLFPRLARDGAGRALVAVPVDARLGERTGTEAWLQDAFTEPTPDQRAEVMGGNAHANWTDTNRRGGGAAAAHEVRRGR
jgi:hypothetical protein